MLTVRYTDWDGTQRVRLDPDKVFEKFSEYLAYTDDVRQALDWLLRHGAEWEDARVLGLDDLLDAVRDKLRELYDEVNLDRSLDDVRRRIDEAVDLECDTLNSGSPARPLAGEKRGRLDRLPNSPSAALGQLRDHAFADDQARREVENLVERLDDVAALEDFRKRYGELFRGPRALDFEEALELMRQVEQLRNLEAQLAGGDMTQVDAELVGSLLGAQAAREFQNLQRMMQMLRDAGYLATREGRVELSPKAVRRIGQLALRDIFQGLMRDRPGGHRTDHRGLAELRPEATRPYSYGDPMHLDLVGTLKKALGRREGAPLDVHPEDFEIYDTHHAVSTSTVLLLDMSWSMSWEGRFAAAKRVALAMEALVRTRYPRDYFAVVGFYTRAVELKAKELPEATWNMGDPFTNLQDGLRLASRLLSRHTSNNRQIIVVTDGQPTAYFSRGRLYCEWPLTFGGISARAARETLAEVERATRRGITINTFMLDDSPTLRAFVEKMTRINKGRALFTRPDHLGEYLLVDYIGRRRKKV